MKDRDRLPTSPGKLWPRRRHVLGALGVCALLLFAGLFARWRRPVLETITTGGGRPASATPATSVYFTPQLPPRDADVETAGDHIAAATMYLKNRQSAAALRAMTQARAATGHAIARRRQQGRRFDVLQETLTGIDSAERYVRRGALGDARARLASLTAQLDELTVRLDESLEP